MQLLNGFLFLSALDIRGIRASWSKKYSLALTLHIPLVRDPISGNDNIVISVSRVYFLLKLPFLILRIMVIDFLYFFSLLCREPVLEQSVIQGLQQRPLAVPPPDVIVSYVRTLLYAWPQSASSLCTRGRAL